MQDYEMVLILRAGLSDEEAKLVVDKVIDRIGRGDGGVAKLENWGRRKLAYPINHFNEGNYFFAQFRAKPSQLKELRNHLNLQQEIIRYLVIRVEEQ